MTNFHITIDDRDARSEVVHHLSQTAGVTVKISRLEIGDYLVNDTLCVERKTLPDFASSIKDGRLLRQASKLASYLKRTAIILEGTAADVPLMRIRREAIQGAIISVTVISGIPVLRSRDAEETARLLCYAGRQLSNNSSRSVARKDMRPRGKERIQVHILQGFPLVGPVRAQHLLNAFHSVRGILLADEERLAQVRGIGHKVARNIRWLVDG